DEEHVTDDGPGDGRLDEVIQAGVQRDAGDDQFGRIAEGGVEQAPHSLTQPFSELLRGVAHQPGQGDDRERRGYEDGDWTDVDYMLQHQRNRKEYEQPVEQVLLGEDPLRGRLAHRSLPGCAGRLATVRRWLGLEIGRGTADLDMP